MKLSGLLLFFVPLASARAVRYHHQIPIAEGATKDLTSAKELDLDTTPSIGVHFTTSQAVAAARYANGTTIDIVKIPGDAGYIDLMSRWMFRYSDYEILRNRNDSVVLATFLSKVHATIGAQLDSSITQITPTVVFPLRRAQKTLFQSALLLAGFASSKESSTIYPEAYATHAALEHTSCARQTLPEQHQHVLVIAFDDSSFSASMHQTSCDAQSPQPHMINYVTRSDLGWWNLPVYDAPRAKFWSKLQEAVIHAVSGLGKPPGRIVLSGSHGGDKEFKETVEDALWTELEVDVGTLLGSHQEADNEWLAARGAAELGWRSSH
ncbi:uncharacterized protein ALTATR162_LOCUS4805 [Alternaria atra]|uniref:Uncharacterized protein n=1 Tax=Alternaria atra TaxID=119953 RepID=A0A8J2MZF1_9PLEO|nr:uncharacterized protein ALTATR162_LOCUS4805 [Alternaria atra]CAG5157012.1 unnamed protein product [Alternaria atra]